MQWKTEKKYQDTEIQQDVYTDVKTSFSADTLPAQDASEFSLRSIQEKLGEFTAQQEADRTAGSPDTMPSSQTLTMSYQREYAVEKSVSKVSAKFKIAVACYAFVVLALILAVTLCGVAVSGSFGGAVILNSEYTTVASQVDQLDKQIAMEDYESLVERATALGYIDASQSNTMTYTKLETRPAQNFGIQTNWFDNLCDWLCNVFGG